MMWTHATIVVLLELTSRFFQVQGVVINNAIVGTPRIVCERDSITFEVETEKPFRGKVFVKGEYSNNDCVSNYAPGSSGGSGGSISEGRIGGPRNFGSGQGGFGSGKGPQDEGEVSGNGGREEVGLGIFPHRGSSSGGSPGSGQGVGSRGGQGSGDGARGSGTGGSGGFGQGEHSPGPGFGGTDADGFPFPDKFPIEEGEGSGGSRNQAGPNNGEFRKGAKVWTGQEGQGGAIATPWNSGGFKRPSDSCPLVCPPCSCLADQRRKRDTSRAKLEVRLGTCNAKRDRTVSPPGVHVSFVVVVSFHENFITKLDRAYRIECAYMEANKTVTTQFDVSMPATTELTNVVEPPTCEYRIKNNIGETLHNVQIGDIVRHEFRCNSPTASMFGLLVHSCYAEDGQGQRELVIDEHGCSLDGYVWPTPTYSKNELSASVEAYVFKFPDRDSLDFQCAISVCLHDTGECENFTPPVCTGIQRNRTRREVTERRKSDDWLLHAQTLTVVDLDDRPSLSKALAAGSLPPPPERTFCVSVFAFGAIVAASTFLVTVAAVIGFAVLFLRDPFKGSRL